MKGSCLEKPYKDCVVLSKKKEMQKRAEQNSKKQSASQKLTHRIATPGGHAVARCVSFACPSTWPRPRGSGIVRARLQYVMG